MLATALLLTGCAEHFANDGPDFDGPGRVVEAPISAAPPARGWAPVSVGHEQTTVVGSWGEPSLTPVGLEPGPQAVADTDGPYLLDTGDKLRIFVYGQPNLSRLYTVDHGGFVAVPLIGRVSARGSTAYQVAARIRDRLSTQYVRDPQVTVDVFQNRPFFIMGEVRNGGQFPYVSGMTVQTAVAIAGGYSERARQTNARITRRINGVMEVLDVPSDYVLQPGDVVEIPERLF